MTQQAPPEPDQAHSSQKALPRTLNCENGKTEKRPLKMHQLWSEETPKLLITRMAFFVVFFSAWHIEDAGGQTMMDCISVILHGKPDLL